jgi:hypothetical protein
MERHSEPRKSEQSSLVNKVALTLFIVVLGFFLWTEHQAHLFGALPYLILLLCPLIHIFMHKGHGKGH